LKERIEKEAARQVGTETTLIRQDERYLSAKSLQ